MAEKPTGEIRMMCRRFSDKTSMESSVDTLRDRVGTQTEYVTITGRLKEPQTLPSKKIYINKKQKREEQKKDNKYHRHWT